MRALVKLIIGTAVVGVIVPLGAAQSPAIPYGDVGGRISRPGSAGPSQNLGGRYTRLAPLQATHRNVSLFSQQPVLFGNTHRQYDHAQALSTAQVGMQGYQERSRGGIGALRYNPDLAALSGIEGITDVGLPLPGMSADYVPGIDAYLYTPPRDADRFAELLGLTSAAPPVVERVGTVAEQLEAATAEKVRRAERDGLALFKRGTVEMRTLDPVTNVERYQECVDCDKNLRGAVSDLTMVGTLDKGAFVPYLLLPHAYLEQDRAREALGALLELMQRRPDFATMSAAEGSFADYFGDAHDGRSAFLDAQMRRYSKMSELNKDSAEALALEIYCTWRLGEFARSRDGAQQLAKLAQERPVEDGYLLDYAIRMRDANGKP